MNKEEPVGGGQRDVTVSYGKALELIQGINEKKDNLGLELLDWIVFGDDVIGMVCDLFGVEVPDAGKEKEVKKRVEEHTKEVTTVIEVSYEGEIRQRTVHVNWWRKLSLDEIADTTAEIVEEIVGRGELEEGTI